MSAIRSSIDSLRRSHSGRCSRGLGHVYNVLNGSDAVVYQSTRALGFEPVLHMYYDDGFSPPEGVIADVVVSFSAVFEECSVRKIAQGDGGSIFKDPHSGPDQFENPEPMEWVTLMTTYCIAAARRVFSYLVATRRR
jgi:hypothetical protein